MHRGFIQIPILIAIIGGIIALGGTGYVAYEIGQKTTKSTSQETVDSSTDTQTSFEASTDTQEITVSAENSIIDSLKKQVDDLAKKVNIPRTETAKTNIASEVAIITLPSGAVVEMDVDGNIIRTIKEAPQKTEATPITNTQTQTFSDIQIFAVNVISTTNVTKIEWQTNKPAQSKLFLSGGGLSSKLYSSESGLSTRHSVSITGLKGSADYSYEIEAVMSDYVFTKKNGEFSTPVSLGITKGPLFSVKQIRSDGHLGYYHIILETSLATSLEMRTAPLGWGTTFDSMQGVQYKSASSTKHHEFDITHEAGNTYNYGIRVSADGKHYDIASLLPKCEGSVPSVGQMTIENGELVQLYLTCSY